MERSDPRGAASSINAASFVLAAFRFLQHIIAAVYRQAMVARIHCDSTICGGLTLWKAAEFRSRRASAKPS